MTTFFSHVYLDSQRLRVPPCNVGIGVWGGSPDNDDNYGAIYAAMAAVHELGGGTVEFGPWTYKCLSRLDVPDGVALRGVPGKTKLDFSGKPTYERSVTDGLIRGEGTLGAPIAITHDTFRTAIVSRRITAATRSGITVTATVDIPHSYAVGDPVWIIGRPATAAQAVFFTINYAGAATTSSARTNPFLVTGIVDSTHFTYAILADTGDTTLDTVGNPATVSFSSDTLIVADTSSFSVNQDIMIQSDQFRFNSSTEKNNIGEFAKISRIVSPTQLRLHADVQDNYTSTFVDNNGVTQPANPKIVAVNFHRNFHIEGFEIIGKGANFGLGLGDRGIKAYLCESPHVSHCTFTRVDFTGVYIWSCMGGSVHDNLFSWDSSDEAGSSSGLLDVQYGVGFGGCVTGLEIRNNHFWGGRHSIVQTFSNTAPGQVFYGISRNVHVVGNTCQGQWLAAISSHTGVDTWIITDNVVTGSQAGINPRYGRDVVMANNVISAYGYGIYVYNFIGNFTASANTIRAGTYGLLIARDVDPNTDYGPLKIVNNNVEGGATGIRISDATLGLTTTDVEIAGNSIRSTTGEAILVNLGDSSDAANGWTGNVRGNTIIDAGLGGSSYAVRLVNFKAGQVNDNTIKGSVALNYAFYIDGAGTGDRLQFMDNQVAAGLVASRSFNVSAGKWHLTNLPPLVIGEATTVIAAGVAAPFFARPLVVIDTEAAAASDDLDTLAAGFIGQTVTLRSTSNARAVTVKDGTGNIQTGADRVLDNTRDTLTLMYDGTTWNEIAFASN